MALASCAVDSSSGEDGPSATRSTSASQGALTRDLDVGDRGVDVEIVNQYLMRYGYFPNAELARTYPRWQPITEVSPASMDVYDEHTADAVLALQAWAGLEQTGFVDEATRALLESPRCAHPDGERPRDPNDKFNVFTPGFGAGGLFNKHDFTFKQDPTNLTTLNNPKAPSPATMELRIQQMLDRWGSATSPMTFTKTTGSTPDIAVRYTHGGPDGQATTNGICTGGLCGCVTTTPPTAPLPCNAQPAVTLDADRLSEDGTLVDARSLLIHELGHALGLAHSPQGTNVMGPFLNKTDIRSALTVDDRTGIRDLYDVFDHLSGSAYDIGVGTNGTTDTAWMVSTTQATSGGFKVKKWSGGAWQFESDGKGALAISVESSGKPWIVDSTGKIFARSTADHTTGSWVDMTWDAGCAGDIAVTSIDNAWIIGCDGHIYKFIRAEARWQQDPHGSNGLRIAVGPDGRPWHINTSHKVYQRKNSDITSTAGYTKKENAAGTAGGSDVAVSFDNVGYVVGASGMSCGSAATGGSKLCVWDEQAASTGVGAVKDFVPVTQAGGFSIAVGANAALWFTNDQEQVWKSRR